MLNVLFNIVAKACYLGKVLNPTFKGGVKAKIMTLGFSHEKLCENKKQSIREYALHSEQS